MKRPRCDGLFVLVSAICEVTTPRILTLSCKQKKMVYNDIYRLCCSLVDYFMSRFPEYQLHMWLDVSFKEDHQYIF